VTGSGPLSPSDPAVLRRQLRARLAEPGIVVVPGVTNALFARLAAEEGIEAVFTTGAGMANTLFGYPDLGLVTMTEIVEANRQIARAVAVPVIADADTGYGNHVNVIRTVEALEAAGVAAVVLEDQVAPKKCGHFDHKAVVAPTEMVEKLLAARTARSDPALVLVARTDAIACEGLDAALARASLYARAGADVIFVEAPTTTEEMAAIPASVSLPCLINVVEGGRTPQLPSGELGAMGFKIALYANTGLRTAAAAVRRAMRVLRTEGTTVPLAAELMSWEDRQILVRLPEWQRLDADISAEARRVVGIEAGDPLGLT
jgi:2-methylisocitrate lyase-like PEP mutase family enzyme